MITKMLAANKVVKGSAADKAAKALKELAMIADAYATGKVKSSFCRTAHTRWKFECDTFKEEYKSSATAPVATKKETMPTVERTDAMQKGDVYAIVENGKVIASFDSLEFSKYFVLNQIFETLEIKSLDSISRMYADHNDRYNKKLIAAAELAKTLFIARIK